MLTAVSVVVLLLLLLGPPARFVWYYQFQTHFPWRLIHFYFIWFFYTRLVWGTQIDRPVPLPRGRGAFIVCNHVSSLDPWFVQVGLLQNIHWLVAREYSLHPKMAWIFRAVEAIPVNRSGNDTAATKLALRYARAGEVVGLFPEGRINDTEELLLPGRPGVALLALSARVPVIPCFVSGAPYDGTEFGCFGMWARTRVKVGDPIDLSQFYARRKEKEALEEVTLLLMRAMASLAGRPDYEPKLAGRFWRPGMGPPTENNGTATSGASGDEHHAEVVDQAS